MKIKLVHNYLDGLLVELLLDEPVNLDKIDSSKLLRSLSKFLNWLE